MFPASSKGGGQCFGMPDVCKTPSPGGPVPIPYPNIGMLAQAKKTAKKVKLCNKAAVTKKSKISMSSGDEAGVAKGVVSSKNMSTVTFKKGSSKVKVEGQSLQHLTAPTGHNGSNANVPGAQIAPSQTKVIIT